MTASPKRLALVAGARPNFMKVAPLVRAIGARPDRLSGVLVHTGQHYDHEMSGAFFADLEIPPPDANLEVGSGTHAEQTARVMLAFEPFCLRERPDCVVVVGDVNSTLACALVAAKLHIPVAHVEAGLRSGDRRMPEEINRIVTDALSDFLFVTEPSGVDHLLAEGRPRDRIVLAGNTMVDSLLFSTGKLARGGRSGSAAAPLKAGLPQYAVLTLHRPENVDERPRFAALLEAVAAVASRIPVVFPVHPRTAQRMEAFALAVPAGVRRAPPLGYLDFLELWSGARLVLTDSGGLQEETTALGVPCLTLRDATERPITVEDGTNTVVGADRRAIVEAVDAILGGRGKTGRRPALWDGRAAERIVGTLAERL